jgi:hypothetical protein
MFILLFVAALTASLTLDVYGLRVPRARGRVSIVCKCSESLGKKIDVLSSEACHRLILSCALLAQPDGPLPREAQQAGSDCAVVVEDAVLLRLTLGNLGRGQLGSQSAAKLAAVGQQLRCLSVTGATSARNIR